MKFSLIATSLLLTSIAFANAKNYEVKMKEGQMHCGSCAEKVSNALKGLPEVDKGSVKVLIEKNKAVLQIKDSSKVSADQIKKAIETAGYTVTSVEELKTDTKKN